MTFTEYLETLKEGFDDDFMKGLDKVKKQDKLETGDLDDDRVSSKLKKNLESLVKILNKKVDDEWTEKDFYAMTKRLFDKKESKRILNHFLRKKIITGATESASKVTYMVMRTIQRKDFMNFY